MAKTLPTSLRISESLLRRVDEAAERLGSTRAGVIKLCLSSFLDHFEDNGGIASLPLDWKEIIEESDGRTRLARGSVSAGDPSRSHAALETSNRNPNPVRKLERLEGSGGIEEEFRDLEREAEEAFKEADREFED